MSFLSQLGVNNAHRLVLQEGARWTQGSLTKALNTHDDNSVRRCITRNPKILLQRSGERPTVLKGSEAFVTHFRKERESYVEAGIGSVRYSFTDLVCTSEGDNVIIESQFFVISEPRGGLFGGVVRTGSVEDVYVPDSSHENELRMKLESRHIRADASNA